MQDSGISSDRRMLKQKIKGMFAGNDDIEVYKKFCKWIGKPEMFKLRKDRSLEYSDLAPLAYMHLVFEGNTNISNVKHLLIDEMQDYTPVQYKVLKRLFSCRKTILGDMGQTLNSYSWSDVDMISKVFSNGVVMKLCKSYRSTFEIADFARKIKRVQDMEPIARHGQKPGIVRFDNLTEEISGIAGFVNDFRGSSYESLGIICRSDHIAAVMSEQLNSCSDDINYISTHSAAFSKGVVVTSVCMAKGLEFDEIIIPCLDGYITDSDSGLLYIAVTRAMHRVTLTLSCGKEDLNRHLLRLNLNN